MKEMQDSLELNIARIIENGIPLGLSQPYLNIADQFGIDEGLLIETIKRMISTGKIKRFGPVILNRSNGLNQNAMVTMKIDINKIDETAHKLATYPFVTLCYQRRPKEKVWDYNLYCMVHGSDRQIVLNQIETMMKEQNIPENKYKVLFSTKCFKQKGASY